jgi:hypothetical protein
MKTHRKEARADPDKENVSNKRTATDLPDNTPRKRQRLSEINASQNTDTIPQSAECAKETAENAENGDPENPLQVTENAMETEPSSSKCNWCTQLKSLLPGKKFCQSCSENGRECRWCHRPLPERFYSKRTDVCDRCIDRHRRWQTGGGNKTALEGAVETRVLEPNQGNLWDVLQFFRDNSDQIRYFL